jgi:hypothetical protein
MYERMLDKNLTPSEATIREWLGKQSYERLAAMESCLETGYALVRKLKFPFGNNYGWGYKYSHKSSHLCYAFFEKGSFTVTLQIGDKAVSAAESILQSLLPKTRELWKSRYPCGDCGGWVHYRVLADEELADVFQLLSARKKPSKI